MPTGVDHYELKLASWYTEELRRRFVLELEKEIRMYRRLLPLLRAAKVPDLWPWLNASWLLLEYDTPSQIIALLTSEHPSDIIESIIKQDGMADRDGRWQDLPK